MQLNVFFSFKEKGKERKEGNKKKMKREEGGLKLLAHTI